MRRIVSAGPASRGGGAVAERPDGYFDRIIKYIPTEVVAGWVALDGLSKGMAVPALWALFAIVAALACLWMLKQTRVEGQPPATRQALIATLSFAVWAFALQSGPFESLTYDPRYGSMALVLYTLGIGLVEP